MCLPISNKKECWRENSNKQAFKQTQILNVFSRSQEQFFLTEGQNNFRNKIPIVDAVFSA